MTSDKCVVKANFHLFLIISKCFADERDLFLNCVAVFQALERGRSDRRTQGTAFCAFTLWLNCKRKITLFRHLHRHDHTACY